MHEVEKALDVGQKLGVEIPGHVVVLSHTPFRGLVGGKALLRNRNVLVMGSDSEKCREIARRWVAVPGARHADDPEETFC